MHPLEELAGIRGEPLGIEAGEEEPLGIPAQALYLATNQVPNK